MYYDYRLCIQRLFQLPLSSLTLLLTRLPTRNRYVALKFLVAEIQNDIDNAADVSESQKSVPKLSNEIEVLGHLRTTSLRSLTSGGARILSLLDHFVVSGPNGSHLVLVTEVTGPRVSSLPRSGDVVRDVCRQIVQGVDYLHQQGIGHGGKSRLAIHDIKRSPFMNRIRKAEYQKTRLVVISSNVHGR